MAFRPLRVTFHFDGSGIYYDAAEPPMLAGLLDVCFRQHHTHGDGPMRDEAPIDISMPVARWTAGETWGWRASALMPEGVTAETVRRWRKRLRQSRIAITDGSPNTGQGTYRDWDMPVPVTLTHRLVGYACGEADKVRRELRRYIRWVGKKRAHGLGRVTGIDVDILDGPDRSVIDPMTSAAMQYLPVAGGARLVRPRPPYWSSVDRVACCEIGDIVDWPATS